MEPINSTQVVVIPDEHITLPVTSTLSPDDEARVVRETERETQWKTDSIERYKKYLRDAEGELAEIPTKVRDKYVKRAEARRLLAAAGFEAEESHWDSDLDLHTTEDRLKDVYAAIGRLDKDTECLDPVGDARKQLVKVSIRSAHFPMVVVRFTRKLKKTDKCRVETVVEKRRQLICRS